MTHRGFAWRVAPAFAALLLIAPAERTARGADLGKVPRYHVLEVALKGPRQGPSDTPARDVELAVSFRHEAGGETVRAVGFWDGDGKGRPTGGVFKVRFCPTRVGRWRIVRAESNRKELSGQREGDELVCVPSKHPGRWVPDGRWYGRSDGSHPYIVGNTHYTFLSRRTDRGAAKTDPVADIRANAGYFKKLRFSLGGGRYTHPTDKPFLDDSGRPSDHGRFSLRPNPTWFRRRVDPVIREGFATDLICDLIVCGPDTREIRSTLQGDPSPWLRYLAARYGAYPNVWFCLCNEWNIKQPSYKAEQIVRAGRAIRACLPYATGLAVHGNTGNWNTKLNGAWHDHVTIQWKLKRLDRAADAAAANYARGGKKPVCNDENAYEGKGDRFSEGDVIEGCFGTFLGGGYPTTGEKYAGKKGQYFWGGFDAAKHHAADNLLLLREYVDERVTFWRMEPIDPKGGIFSSLPEGSRLLGEEQKEYVLGTNRRARNISAKLPAGTWRITQVDLMTKKKETLGEAASGRFTFAAPPSRAAMTHFRRTDPPRPK